MKKITFTFAMLFTLLLACLPEKAMAQFCCCNCPPFVACIAQGVHPNCGNACFAASGGGCASTPSGLSNCSDVPACAALLPVEYTFFRGVNSTSGAIELTWQTASESNNEGFEVQRMSSTIRDWEAIYFQDGQGTGTEEKDYSFVDRTPLFGLNYYRLAQHDYDGHIEYSQVISVDNRGGDKVLRVFPTLVKEELSIRINEELDQPPHIQVFDAMGKRMMSFDGSNNGVINLIDLPNGPYTITVTYDQQRWVERFVKIN